MRILVTGWRHATLAHRPLVWDALDDAAFSRGTRFVTVVHGACPTGVDHYADEWAARTPNAKPEPYPANWERYGKAAGPMRNLEMVRLGADLCLAFPPVGKREKYSGTWHCLEAAALAGIYTIITPLPEGM